MRLAENTGRKKSRKIRHLRTIAHLCRAISSQLRHVLTIGKSLLNSNMSSMCPPNMVKFGPQAAEIGSLLWGTPGNFNSVTSSLRYCSDVTNRTRTTLCVMFGRLLGWYGGGDRGRVLFVADPLAHITRGLREHLMEKALRALVTPGYKDHIGLSTLNTTNWYVPLCVFL